jgi:hypothetical protein
MGRALRSSARRNALEPKARRESAAAPPGTAPTAIVARDRPQSLAAYVFNVKAAVRTATHPDGWKIKP